MTTGQKLTADLRELINASGVIKFEMLHNLRNVWATTSGTAQGGYNNLRRTKTAQDVANMFGVTI